MKRNKKKKEKDGNKLKEIFLQHKFYRIEEKTTAKLNNYLTVDIK